MDLTDDLRGGLPGDSRQDEQAVIICLQFPVGKFEDENALAAVVDLDDIFTSVIETSGLGTYNGHALFVGNEDESLVFVISGQDANLLYREIKPILEFLPQLPGSYIIKRYTSSSEDLMHFK